ncbi:LPS export ABC transporter periplasmic protein LptC [Terrihabitans sp. B22-R8]|uniref:LPS export ABC transporter periplasmic protein LptC n=1 Tax=Terrihabitans sp. B22-R8 TaxID=3425128 RepID=UPI00403C04F9
MSFATYDAASGGLSLQDKRARALAAARRHTRLVRFLRVALPCSALLLPLAVVVPIVLAPVANLPNVDLEAIGITSTGIAMEHPKMTGFNEDRRAYEITADRAEQNLSTPTLLGLIGIRGQMEGQNKGWTRLTAARGMLETKTEVLDLTESILVETDLGDRATLTQARVAFSAGEIQSDAPVEISTSKMNLKAQRMHVTESGDSITFEGGVVMVLSTEPDPAPETPQ